MAESPKQAMDISDTIATKLSSKKRRLELELSEVNAALDAMNAHPEVAQVLNLVSKAVRI